MRSIAFPSALLLAAFVAFGCNSTPAPANPAETSAPLTSSSAPAETAPPPPSAAGGAAAAVADSGCEIGGCSGEVCQKAGAPKMFSTCDYKPEWQCYKTAHCALGADGSCGWKSTPELDKCLAVH
jgi:hypothetical protein